MPAAVETMMSVRELPWHRLGKVVERQLTAEEALKEAGLDWEVKRHPFYIHVDGQVAPVEVKGKFATVRDSDNAVLGSVGSAYRVLQNRDAFAFADGLVDDGSAHYETAGSLKGGKKVWMMMTLPQGIQIAGEDVSLYLALTNSHDGKSAVQVMVTPVRIVCQNTMNLAVSQAERIWSVRHVGSMDGRLEEARRALDMTFGYVEEFQQLGENLAAQHFSGREFGRMVRDLVPDDEEEQEKIIESYSDSPNLGNIRDTKWGAINAIGEYYDWVRPQRSDEAKFKNATTGIGRKQRDRALELLTA